MYGSILHFISYLFSLFHIPFLFHPRILIAYTKWPFDFYVFCCEFKTSMNPQVTAKRIQMQRAGSQFCHHKFPYISPFKSKAHVLYQKTVELFYDAIFISHVLKRGTIFYKMHSMSKNIHTYIFLHSTQILSLIIQFTFYHCYFPYQLI